MIKQSQDDSYSIFVPWFVAAWVNSEALGDGRSWTSKAISMLIAFEVL